MEVNAVVLADYIVTGEFHLEPPLEGHAQSTAPEGAFFLGVFVSVAEGILPHLQERWIIANLKGWHERAAVETDAQPLLFLWSLVANATVVHNSRQITIWSVDGEVEANGVVKGLELAAVRFAGGFVLDTGSGANGLADGTDRANKMMWLEDIKAKAAQSVLNNSRRSVLDATREFRECVAEELAF